MCAKIRTLPAPEPALQKWKDCFCVNGLTRKFKKGQSFHHILASDADQITVGKKTVYRYINVGLLRTKRGDMPRSC